MYYIKDMHAEGASFSPAGTVITHGRHHVFIADSGRRIFHSDLTQIVLSQVLVLRPDSPCQP